MDELEQLFSALRAGQEGRARSMAEIFSDALGSVDSMQAPAAMPVPGVANPFGAMASTFAATLADQLGARGSLAANEQRLGEQKENQQRVEQANFARSEAFNHEKQMQRMGILLKVGEMKAKALEQSGDLEKFEAQTKANLMLAERARKAQEDFDLKKLDIEHKNKLSEIIAAKKQTPEERKADLDSKAQEREDKEILRFQEDISNIAKKPGSTLKTKEGGFLGIGTHEATNLSRAAIQQVRGRSAATAKSAVSKRLREVALQTYVDTLRDPTTGKVDTSTPEYDRFWTMLKSVMPNAADRNAFLDAIAIQ